MYFTDMGDQDQATVTTFQGKTAIAFAQVEWQRVKDGKEGIPIRSFVSGDVHCVFLKTGSGDADADCWAWDSSTIVVVFGLNTPQNDTADDGPAVADLLLQIEAANDISATG